VRDYDGGAHRNVRSVWRTLLEPLPLGLTGAPTPVSAPNAIKLTPNILYFLYYSPPSTTTTRHERWSSNQNWSRPPKQKPTLIRQIWKNLYAYKGTLYTPRRLRTPPASIPRILPANALSKMKDNLVRLFVGNSRGNCLPRWYRRWPPASKPSEQADLFRERCKPAKLHGFHPNYTRVVPVDNFLIYKNIIRLDRPNWEQKEPVR